MRLHGRNAAQWWQHEKSEDRYNYLYSGESSGNLPTRQARQKSSCRKRISTRTITSPRNQWSTP
jgi:hypothetical protein